MLVFMFHDGRRRDYKLGGPLWVIPIHRIGALRVWRHFEHSSLCFTSALWAMVRRASRLVLHIKRAVHADAYDGFYGLLSFVSKRCQIVTCGSRLRMMNSHL